MIRMPARGKLLDSIRCMARAVARTRGLHRGRCSSGLSSITGRLRWARVRLASSHRGWTAKHLPRRVVHQTKPDEAVARSRRAHLTRFHEHDPRVGIAGRQPIHLKSRACRGVRAVRNTAPARPRVTSKLSQAMADRPIPTTVRFRNRDGERPTRPGADQRPMRQSNAKELSHPSPVRTSAKGVELGADIGLQNLLHPAPLSTQAPLPQRFAVSSARQSGAATVPPQCDPGIVASRAPAGTISVSAPRAIDQFPFQLLEPDGGDSCAFLAPRSRS